MASTVQPTYRNPNVTTAAATLIATGAQILVGWNLINKGTSNAFLKLYNAAAAVDVTVGTTTPVRTLLIPGSGTAFLSNEDKWQKNFPLGMVFAVTGDMLDTDSSAPSGACHIEVLYAPPAQ